MYMHCTITGCSWAVLRVLHTSYIMIPKFLDGRMDNQNLLKRVVVKTSTWTDICVCGVCTYVHLFSSNEFQSISFIALSLVSLCRQFFINKYVHQDCLIRWVLQRSISNNRRVDEGDRQVVRVVVLQLLWCDWCNASNNTSC